MPDVPQLKTRKPTGKPPWPMTVVAGGEKTGKSWSGAEFSASDLIDRTFWVEIGEGAADQYGALPGARYEIVEHDGTYQGIGGALWAATKQPRGESGKPHAIVVDGVSALWEMLSDEAQGVANARARRAAERRHQPIPDGDRTIGPDLWNAAKARWKRVISLLRRYDGPVILLTRLEHVAVIGRDGNPTTERTWSVKAEKNLPFEADAIVRFTAPRTAELTGVRSMVLRLEPGEAIPLPDFTIDRLLRDLGLGEPEATLPRAFTAPRPDWMEAERDANGAYAAEPQERRRADIPPGAPRPQPTEIRQAGASTSVQNKLLGLIERKLDLTDRDDQMRWISGELHRHLAAPDQLGVSDAMGLIRRLEDTPEREQPWDEQPQVPPAADAPSRPEAQQPRTETARAASWSHRMAADRGTPMTTKADGSDQMFEDMAIAIADATDPDELEGLHLSAKNAHEAGKLTAAQFGKLDQLGRAQNEDLRAKAGAGV